MIEDAFNEVLEGYLKSNHRKKVEIINRAFNFAKEAHKGRSDAGRVSPISCTL